MTSPSNNRLRVLGGIALVLIGLVLLPGAVAVGASRDWDWDAEVLSSGRTGSNLLAYVLTSLVFAAAALVGGVMLLVAAVRAR